VFTWRDGIKQLNTSEKLITSEDSDRIHPEHKRIKKSQLRTLKLQIASKLLYSAQVFFDHKDFIDETHEMHNLWPLNLYTALW